MKKILFLFAGLVATWCFACPPTPIYAKDYGIAPDKTFTANDVERMLTRVREMEKPYGAEVIFEPGTYRITEKQCQRRKWFISNHDQVNPRKVFLPIENMQRTTWNFNGATFELDGRILFAGVFNSEETCLRRSTVDVVTPMIVQIQFLEVDKAKRTVRFKVEGEGVKTELRGTQFFVSGTDFRYAPHVGILFNPDKTIAYRTSDCAINLSRVKALEDGTFLAENCANSAFAAGQHMALRSYDRPAPGIVISDSKDVELWDMTLHYADGMGVIAQSSENLLFHQLRVIPNRAKGRYYSTQADATHFSGCYGKIESYRGVYEGMMDDAINVHGTYLKVTKRIDDTTLEAAYQHYQTYGISWGEADDRIGFVRAKTLETEGWSSLAKVEVLDPKRLRLSFQTALPAAVDPTQDDFGLENITRTPSVDFSGNRIAYNRARGALFSTLKKVRCTENLFDNISGCAILLCGDCRGWYESGPCKDVLIAENTFRDVLTSPFQFTEAVISIAPVIVQPDAQKTPYHSSIVIEQNYFETFDKPLVFAESVDGLTIRDNTYLPTTTYKPYHWNKEWLTTRRCMHLNVEPPKVLDAAVSETSKKED